MNYSQTFLIDGWRCELQQHDLNVDYWYLATVEGFEARNYNNKPERAVKQAFQRYAVAIHQWDRHRCAVCQHSLGDDIECYRSECDASVRLLFK